MDRRETLKLMLLGSVGGGIALAGCKTDPKTGKPITNLTEGNLPNYGIGRTDVEMARDIALDEDEFLTEEELGTIAILSDIILPADALSGSATEAEVPAFIHFMVKDIEDFQLQIRGGLAWLHQEALSRYESSFESLTNEQQLAIVDDIAYSDEETLEQKPTMVPGIKFFDLMRNLVVTGFYTSKMGIEALGYVGNTPNDWDGVPEDAMKGLSVQYDPEWIAKCVNPETRSTIAEWDDEGNLLT